MVLLPGERDDTVANADNIHHDPNLLTRSIQRRPLLDMQFDKPGEPPRINRRPNPVPDNPTRLTQRNALMIPQRIRLSQGQPTGPNIRPGGHAIAPLFILKRHS